MELKPGMSAFVTGGASGIVCIPVGVLAIMGPAFTLLDDTLRELMVTLELQDMHAKFQAGDLGLLWTFTDHLLVHDRRIYVPASLPSLQAASAHAAHEGIQNTLHHLSEDFHAPKACQVVEAYVRSYVTFQCNKIGICIQPVC